jgi:hypothetical protein
VWGFALAAGLMPAIGCYGLTGQAPTPPGPGVPTLLTVRFEPDTVRGGEETTLILTFEDTDANVAEAYLVERVISNFQLISTTNVIPLDIRRHLGQVVGTVREPFRWDAPSIRFYDVYVVDLNGNVSNRIAARVTVR